MTKAEHAKSVEELREAMKDTLYWMPTDWRLSYKWQYVNEARYILPNGAKCNDEFYREWKRMRVNLSK